MRFSRQAMSALVVMALKGIYDSDSKLRTYYIDLMKSVEQKVNYLALVNARDNKSALLAQLVRLRGAFPIIVDIDPAWSNEKKGR